MTERDNSMAWVAVVVIIAALALLIYMAREGDVTAIVVLAVLGVLVFLVLGGGIVLLVMGKMDAMEQRRFRANVKENLVLMELQQRAMSRQLESQMRINRGLTYQNQQLARSQQEPDFGLDLDALLGDDSDLLDLEQDNGRWAAR